ncbi:MAG TPA: ferredoxin--NADP reductase [Gemmataceae bacterium]|nr:ferredoxin--NADP reductase [Gemmataceae bacterium]
MTPGQITDLRRTRYNATVAWLRKPNPDLMLIRVRPDTPPPAHQPGQYSTLGMGGWEPRAPGCVEENLDPKDEDKLIRRAYSISCSILDEQHDLLDMEHANWLEFYVVLVRSKGQGEPAALTPRLFLLKEGDRLFLGDKIAGHFTLEPVKPRDSVVFLATGTGEAPHNYMLWQLLKRGHQGRILSACCVRYQRDLGYLPTHNDLMHRYANYKYLSLTTREALIAGQKVYIQDLITSGQLEEKLGAGLDPARTHVFLCGNPNMIGVPTKNRETGTLTYPAPAGVVEILEKRGFQVDQPKRKGNIHFEEYW